MNQSSRLFLGIVFTGIAISLSSQCQARRLGFLERVIVKQNARMMGKQLFSENERAAGTKKLTELMMKMAQDEMLPPPVKPAQMPLRVLEEPAPGADQALRQQVQANGHAFASRMLEAFALKSQNADPSKIDAQLSLAMAEYWKTMSLSSATDGNDQAAAHWTALAYMGLYIGPMITAALVHQGKLAWIAASIAGGAAFGLNIWRRNGSPLFNRTETKPFLPIPLWTAYFSQKDEFRKLHRLFSRAVDQDFRDAENNSAATDFLTNQKRPLSALRSAWTLTLPDQARASVRWLYVASEYLSPGFFVKGLDELNLCEESIVQ